MRTFIALEIPYSVRNSLCDIQSKIYSGNQIIKWVEKNNLHITLKFIGETDEKEINRISDILTQIAQKTKPYAVKIPYLSAFPNITKPRIIYAGINTGAKETKALFIELDMLLSSGVSADERKDFIPHITLGRVKDNIILKDFPLRIENIAQLKAEPLEFSAQKIMLVKSTLGAKGPYYEVLKEEKLTTK